jgi:hypothetical protein
MINAHEHDHRVRAGPCAELVELEQLLAEEPDDAYEFAGDLAERDSDEDDSAPRGMDTDKHGRDCSICYRSCRRRLTSSAGVQR